MTHYLKRSGMIILLAAIDVIVGSVVGQRQPRYTQVRLPKFFRHIESRTHKDKTLHLTADWYQKVPPGPFVLAPKKMTQVVAPRGALGFA